MSQLCEVNETDIGKLERFGGFFLNSDELNLIIPLVFGSALASMSKSNLDFSILNYRHIHHSSDFVKFVRDFGIFKNNIMVENGITFGERFHGALKASIYTKLHIQKMSKYSSKTYEMPLNTTLIETQEGEIVDIKEICCYVV